MKEEIKFIEIKIGETEHLINSNIELKFPNWKEQSIKLDKELTIYKNILKVLTQ